jgi:transposase-like protein
MPRPHPPDFRRRAVELARLREKPVAEIARNVGISDSCLRNWMAQADIDNGVGAGLGSDERRAGGVAPQEPCARARSRDPQACKLIYTFIVDRWPICRSRRSSAN